MKKILALLVVLTLALCACAFAEETDALVGHWKLTSIEMAGTAVDPATIGFETDFTLNADGTLSWKDPANGEKEGTWKLDDAGVEITIDGDPEVFAYDGETISAEQDGIKMIFTKTAEGPVGTWYLTEANVGGIIVSAVDAGMEMTITLNEDGTALGKMTDEEDGVGTWEQNGDIVSVTLDGETLDFAFDGESISTEMDGGTMTFKREAASAFVAPEVDTTAIAESYIGDWACVSADYNGMHMAIETLGLEFNFSFDGSSVSIVSGDNTVDGASFEMDGSTLVVVGGDTRINVVLHTDGTLKIDLTDEISLWLEKAE